MIIAIKYDFNQEPYALTHVKGGLKGAKKLIKKGDLPKDCAFLEVLYRHSSKSTEGILIFRIISAEFNDELQSKTMPIMGDFKSC